MYKNWKKWKNIKITIFKNIETKTALGVYVDHDGGGVGGVDYITNHLLTAGDLDVQVAPLVHQQFTRCTLESLSAKAPHSVCAESADCLLRLKEGGVRQSKVGS